MKRSDMVHSMVEHWLGSFPFEEESVLTSEEMRNDTYDNMSRLLAMLEYKGMVPPFNNDPCTKTWNNNRHVWNEEESEYNERS